MKASSQRAGRVSRDILLKAPLPQATKTYTVISHGSIINNILKMLDEAGFKVIRESYAATNQAQIAYGVYHINYGNDPELGLLFAFCNSYNKVLKFSCSVGAFVKQNNSSILSKEGSAWTRVHTGTADQDAADTIEKQITNAKMYYQQLCSDKEAMKQTLLSRQQFAEFMGKLYMDVKLIGVQQLSIVHSEYEKPSYQYEGDPNSLWCLYQHILIALARSHPRTWMEQQKLVHYYMIQEFDLISFEDSVLNSNQLDILTEIDKLETTDEEVKDETPVENTTEEQEAEPAVTEPDGELRVSTHEVEETEAPEKTVADLDAEEDQDWTNLQAKGIVKPMESEKDVEEAVDEKPAEEEKVEEQKEAPKKMTVAVALKQYAEHIPDDLKERLENMGSTPDNEAITMLKDIISKADDKDQVKPLPANPAIEKQAKKVEEVKEEKVVEEVVEETSEEVDETPIDPDDEIFIDKDDVNEMYPSRTLGLGDLIEINDETYVISTDEPGSDMYGITLTEATEEAAEEAAEEVVEETVPDVVEETIPETTEDPFEMGEPEVAEEISLRERSKLINEQIAETKAAEAAAEVKEEQPETPEEMPEVSKEQQDVHDAIGIELNDLYGHTPKFTYEVVDGQYNVKLETGEVITLSESYIKTFIKENL